MSNYKYFPVIISGPSGSGKTQLITYIENNNSEFTEAIGCTTRERRSGELAAMYFISRNEFEIMIQNDVFIEYREYNGNLYGIPKHELIKLDGRHLIFDVSYSAAKVVKDIDPRSKMIYLLPPTKEELLKRLVIRGSESETRYLSGMDETIKHALSYEYLLLSQQDNVEKTYADFMDIVTQKNTANTHKLILSKNRDFVRNYYK